MRHYFPGAFIAVALLCGLAAVAVQGLGENPAHPPASPQDVPLITVHELQALMQKEGSVQIFDVRQPEEYNAGHIQGATLIPLGDLPARYKEIPANRKVVVYCHSGKRSAKAVAFLRDHGYADVFSLSGGYVEWERAQTAH